MRCFMSHAQLPKYEKASVSHAVSVMALRQDVLARSAGQSCGKASRFIGLRAPPVT
jgi:sulfur transfer complex TusBCD TusB component (DsrH family)